MLLVVALLGLWEPHNLACVFETHRNKKLKLSRRHPLVVLSNISDKTVHIAIQGSASGTALLLAKWMSAVLLASRQNGSRFAAAPIAFGMLYMSLQARCLPDGRDKCQSQDLRVQHKSKTAVLHLHCKQVLMHDCHADLLMCLNKH